MYLIGISPCFCKILWFWWPFFFSFRLSEEPMQGITPNHELFISTRCGSLPYIFVISSLFLRKHYNISIVLGVWCWNCKQVLTHRSGSPAMLSLIYSEILKMLRLWGFLDFDVEIFFPHDRHSLPRGYHKQKSKESDNAHILTSQGLLVEVLILSCQHLFFFPFLNLYYCMSLCWACSNS